MKKEYGIARCGLACCLCSENNKCKGCKDLGCQEAELCENLKCSIDKKLEGCYQCKSDCKKGILNKIKAYAFTLFIKRFGVDELLNCLERNEHNGIVYHRQGIIGDYDDFTDVEKLISFIKTGTKA